MILRTPKEMREPLARSLSEVFKLPDHAVADSLSKRLGLRLTAALGKASTTRAASEWAKNLRKPHRIDALRAALQATIAIASHYDDDAARAWFASTNPSLGLCSPLAFLNKANEPEEFDLLVTTALQDSQ
jgi:hypothetical protein